MPNTDITPKYSLRGESDRTCVMVGYYNSVRNPIGDYGGRGSYIPTPGFNNHNMGFSIAYDDEKDHFDSKKPAIRGWNDNSITLGWKTFKPDQTKLPSDIQWRANAPLGVYQSCNVKYDGQEVSGQGYGEKAPVGSILSRCKVRFKCPDGLKKN
jgi:hypothetical protein